MRIQVQPQLLFLNVNLNSSLRRKPYRGQASVMLGSYGRLDQNIEAAVGDETEYARLNTNRSIR